MRKRFDGGYFLDLVYTEPAKWITPKKYKGYKFLRNLNVGSIGDDVNALQTILEANGYFPSNIGTTQYYGGITRQAVKDFQEAHANKILAFFGLTKGTGIFAEKTRALLNELIK